MDKLGLTFDEAHKELKKLGEDPILVKSDKK